MPVQFPYPTDSWSTGSMRKAKAGPQDIMRSGKDYRELEGVRKRKEAEVSEADSEVRMASAEGQYDTQLSPTEEAAFQKWKKKYAPKDSGEDYDLRGAFKSGLTPDPQTGHWPDTFKKPNHPTFSDQSIYAKDRPDLAGSWNGENYVPPGAR